MSPAEFVERRAGGADLTLLDVREGWETEVAAVPSKTLHIPMGGRSMQIAQFLEGRGFKSVYNLAGGILAWSRDLDPRIPPY